MVFISQSLFVLSVFVASISSFLLIPEEIPSILSVIYSRIPPIKKGTDSRIGIGFRLGPNADFQVQFEIGPQTRTQPIGPDAVATNTGSRKRQAAQSQKASYNATNPSEKWLNTFRLNLNDDDNQKLQESLQKPDPTKENFSFVNHLRQLYDFANNTSNDTVL